ncbi:hypothetical protein [Lacibacter sp.]|uniref:hypothetical protein n=1 Tax=Lacibacter sp. TaxID=1915409 RepID=UPI002B4B20B2|nr:hypothetical protein [Lacibacter sp.]HLP37734.1 hypothetical protein [Lacibacter sp.]
MTQPKKINEIMNEMMQKANGNPPPRSKEPRISILQKEALSQRMERLMPQYRKAIAAQNFEDAKAVLRDLQVVLRDLSKHTKLAELKNQFFELALEEGFYDFAIDGFLSNRKLVKTNTRLYLEATALLAISYLRKNHIAKAKPHIREVLQSQNVIKTESTRNKFNKEIIERFDEECVLASLRSDTKQQYNLDSFHSQALQSSNTLTEGEIYAAIGKVLPKLTKDLLYEIDEFSKKQLSYKEQKLLPPPEDVIKDEEAGRTMFKSFKRVVYKSLCDPTSEVYKGWYTNAVGLTTDKKYISGAIAAALAGYGIGFSMLGVSAAALILRFGLDIYCERYKPATVTEFRRKGV